MTLIERTMVMDCECGYYHFADEPHPNPSYYEDKIEAQRKKIVALESQVRRAKDNAELWRTRWERDKRG